MTTINIPLSEVRMEQLSLLAQKSGVSREEFLRRHVEEYLTSEEQFRQAAHYVLKKNQELYRRLS